MHLCSVVVLGTCTCTQVVLNYWFSCTCTGTCTWRWSTCTGTGTWDYTCMSPCQ